MSGLTTYLQNSSHTPPIHPTLQYWRSILQRSNENRAVIEMRRIRDGLSYLPPELYITFFDQAGHCFLEDHDDWDFELDNGLVTLHIRAISLENEMARFGLFLHQFLTKPEIRFGDAFFDAVLLELLDSLNFATTSPVWTKLHHIARTTTASGGLSFSECNNMIGAAFSHCLWLLSHGLQYTQPNAISILEGAIAYYLDDKFSITNRKLLGFIRD